MAHSAAAAISSDQDPCKQRGLPSTDAFVQATGTHSHSIKKTFLSFMTSFQSSGSIWSLQGGGQSPLRDDRTPDHSNQALHMLYYPISTPTHRKFSLRRSMDLREMRDTSSSTWVKCRPYILACSAAFVGAILTAI